MTGPVRSGTLFLILFSLSLAVGAQEPTPKRGYCMNTHRTGDMATMSQGTTWWYNWSLKADISNYLDYGMEFVPMLWSTNFNDNDVRSYLSAHPDIKYIMGFNEPNHVNQSNLTPKQAADNWQRIEAIAAEFNLKIVGPAMNYSPDSPYEDPKVWMDEFFQHCPDCRIDYMNIHAYAAWGNVPSDWADEWYTRYGKPVWVTEFCAWDGRTVTPELQKEYLVKATDLLDNNPRVFRYAWFMAYSLNGYDYPYYNLLDKPGQLTELGNLYVGSVADTGTTTYTNLPITGATASTQLQPSSRAVDNNTASRWESVHGVDPQWLQVDLGSAQPVARVRIDWEYACARDYQVQGSNDAANWMTLASKTGMPAAQHRIDDITNLTGSYRYIRIYGAKRNGSWGYSIWELDVYTSGKPVELSPPAAPTSLSLTPISASKIDLAWTDNATDETGFRVFVSTASTKPATASEVLGANTAQYGASGLEAATKYYFWVEAYNNAGTSNAATGNAITQSAVLEPTVVKMPAVAAFASSERQPAGYAIDNNLSTRWESSLGVDPSWIDIDLGAECSVSRVVLTWEAAYGKNYEILVSSDRNTWTSVMSITGSDGGVDDLTFAAITTRYVRVYGTVRALPYGYSLWDFSVHGTSGAEPPPSEIQLTPVSATASSQLQSAARATDNNTGTRWETNHGINPGWITLDLGSVQPVTRVLIDWEAASARDYLVQGSKDGATWTNLAAKTDMPMQNHRIDEITGLSGTYRYYRIYGTRRNGSWGYSIWELKLYALAESVPKAQSLSDEGKVAVGEGLSLRAKPLDFSIRSAGDRLVYAIPYAAAVSIELRDLTGKPIGTVVCDLKPAGRYEVGLNEFTGDWPAPGMYLGSMGSGTVRRSVLIISH